MSTITNKIWQRAPNVSRQALSLAYHTLKSPFEYERNRNLSKYDVAVGRKGLINYVPPVFDIFISSACNLRCPTCLFRLKDGDVFTNGGMIEVDTLKSVIDRYVPRITTVWLSGGEPLLHPKFHEIVGILKRKALPVMLSTNGLLIEEHIDALQSVDFINVSMDGYDYQSFKRLRGGTQKQFDTIVRNLALLTRDGIKFTISFVLSLNNLPYIHGMIRFARKVSPSCVYFHNINPHGSKDYEPLTINQDVIHVMSDVMGISDYPFDMVLPVVFDSKSRLFKTAKCDQPWGACYFDDKGDIAYCCHLRHNRVNGNIFDGYDFNSESIRSFRNQMVAGGYSEDCLYCERRFAGREYSRFVRASGKWRINESLKNK